MHLSRRELLTAAAGLVAAGCAVQSGSGTGSQTIAPEVVASPDQALDPHLRLSLLADALDPKTVTQFEHETGVVVTSKVEPSGSHLLLELAAGAQGTIDVALVDGATLSYLVGQGLVEPIDFSLVPNRQWLSPPFNDPPYDRRSVHSVGHDYTVIGYAVETEGIITPADTWEGLFTLSRAVSKSVAVPDDSEIVVGAALAATGHPWSSTSSSDLEDARRLLAGVRDSLVVGGPVDRTTLGRRLAAICSGYGFRKPGERTTFVVPQEGSVIRMRSYCILALAPDPVSAHAWLNASLDPFVARQNVMHTRLASTISQVDYLLPQAILTNSAIYPPATLGDKLKFETPAGADARAALWEEVRP